MSTIFSIYEAIKFHKNLTNRIITVTGLGVKKPCNINVKVGSLASDIINYLGGYTKIKNIKLVAGGPMMGRAIISDDLVVTPNLNCLLLIEKVSFDTTIACMRCGKCVEKCPCNLSPVLIKDNIDNIEKLRSLHPERCIECGLCTFVCPSKIDVRKYVKNAKKKVR